MRSATGVGVVIVRGVAALPGVAGSRCIRSSRRLYPARVILQLSFPRDAHSTTSPRGEHGA
jgi:hypothetical protein